MNYLKKCGTFIIVLLIVFWSARIWSINQVSDDTHNYEMNQVIDCGDITICANESFLLTQEEFEKQFELPKGIVDYSEEARIVGICLVIKNVSDNAIEWDDVIRFIEGGFESRTWASSITPLYGQCINKFYTSNLESGACQEIWFITRVSKMCFKDSTWKNIDCENFYYVLSLSPYKVEIRLTT